VISDRKSEIPDHRSQIPDPRSQITDPRSPITDHRSQITDHRSPITDHRSPNLIVRWPRSSFFCTFEITVLSIRADRSGRNDARHCMLVNKLRGFARLIQKNGERVETANLPSQLNAVSEVDRDSDPFFPHLVQKHILKINGLGHFFLHLLQLQTNEPSPVQWARSPHSILILIGLARFLTRSVVALRSV